jgi:hypothetical protein
MLLDIALSLNIAQVFIFLSLLPEELPASKCLFSVEFNQFKIVEVALDIFCHCQHDTAIA